MEIIAPKHTMSLGNPKYPTKSKLLYPHAINILHQSFHHSCYFLSPIQHTLISLKSSKSNTYKTKRPLYNQMLYKGLFLRYLLYFLLSLFVLWKIKGVFSSISHDYFKFLYFQVSRMGINVPTSIMIMIRGILYFLLLILD